MNERKQKRIEDMTDEEIAALDQADGEHASHTGDMIDETGERVPELPNDDSNAEQNGGSS